jgi:uncharacterized protein YjbI with pentapeptide repeats
MKLLPILPALALTAGILFAQSSPPDGKAPLATGLQTDLGDSRFQQVSLANAQFEHSDLSKTTFRSVNLSGAIITSCNLSGAQISSSNIAGMKIDGILVTDVLKSYEDEKKK